MQYRCLVFTDIINEPIWYRILYSYISIPGHRIKYYLAWVLGDLVSNVSGLGFNGYDKNGEPLWDLVTNVNIIEFEVHLSLFFFLYPLFHLFICF